MALSQDGPVKLVRHDRPRSDLSFRPRSATDRAPAGSPWGVKNGPSLTLLPGEHNRIGLECYSRRDHGRSPVSLAGSRIAPSKCYRGRLLLAVTRPNGHDPVQGPGSTQDQTAARRRALASPPLMKAKSAIGSTSASPPSTLWQGSRECTGVTRRQRQPLPGKESPVVRRLIS